MLVARWPACFAGWLVALLSVFTWLHHMHGDRWLHSLCAWVYVSGWLPCPTRCCCHDCCHHQRSSPTTSHLVPVTRLPPHPHLQARSYDEATQNSVLGWYLRNAQTRALSHPLPVMRAREVDRWAQSNQYKGLLSRNRAFAASSSSSSGVNGSGVNGSSRSSGSVGAVGGGGGNGGSSGSIVGYQQQPGGSSSGVIEIRIS